ncbi:hypothetical protein J122_2301 [Marinobacter excellens LAMA 842]|uniref:Uncharacterized protein n=1 Tax=Marinobacter excellens LAMA 842 TaxID=1306954 RepID=A0A137SAH8_9GAMM|nr:hypothetical protein J122_2301 [Marinobacter excellens LAMA 842]
MHHLAFGVSAWWSWSPACCGEVLSGTRCEYVRVRLTAASLLQKVPESTSPHPAIFGSGVQG